MLSTLRWVPAAIMLAACNPATDGDTGPVTDLRNLIDADGDGFFVNDPNPALADCDDREGIGITANPEGREVCDGLDNDCNGTVDDDYADGGLLYYPDDDGDGYGKRWPDGEEVTACEIPDGFSNNRRDCNDSDDQIFPQAPERCNELDDDCDGDPDEGFDPNAIWFLDRDGDGYGGPVQVGEGCATDPEWTRNNEDCNDVMSSVNPEAVERCDGFDNDCDGLVDINDENVEGTRKWYQDADGDGDGNILVIELACGYADLSDAGFVLNSLDCNDANPAQNRNTIWYVDADRDGRGTADATYPTAQCHRPIGHALNTDDCDDTNPEEWSDRLWFADIDGDGAGAGIPVWQGCNAAPGHSPTNDDCDDRDANRKPGAIEVCDGGVDNNCNGLADDDDPDAIGQRLFYFDNDGDNFGVLFETVEACARPEGFADEAGDCDDFNPFFTPVTLWYRDADRDGYGDPDNVWPVSTCTVIPGHVPNANDCDDTDIVKNSLTRWWTDDDGDGLGTGVEPIANGCFEGTDGLAPITGDCDDDNPEDDEGGCFGPQLGDIRLEVSMDGNAFGQQVFFRCVDPSTTPPTIDTLFNRVFFGSDNYADFTFDVGEVEAGELCRAERTSNGNDSWGDGFMEIDVYACGDLIGSVNSTSSATSVPGPIFAIPSCSGCTDPAAENFDADARISTNDESCIYPVTSPL